ncbi:HNH endonuclease [Microbacterium sp. W1N]|uniref:HNH endonuclease signature motif containing protein n=1 Tax=Microbacterium festucae TaxID=2977531 RepID=UPI0021BE894E|nr:HNH endonuclease signature motif containing protein [Microbacterium festucae]MCT9821421.1 HNH endonuclease [Microbacterium festucae]
MTAASILEIDTPVSAPAQLAGIVDGIADRRRRIAALQAEEASLLAQAQSYALARMDHGRREADQPRDIPLRSVAAEIAAATRACDRTVLARMSDADLLVTRFPLTFAHLSDGRIDQTHASVIVAAGLPIDDAEARTGYEQAVLEIAARETPSRLRPLARTLAQRAHPVPLDDRHRAAARGRRVWMRDLDDEMAEFGGIAPAHLVHGIYDRVTSLARAVVDARHGDGDARAGTRGGLSGAPELPGLAPDHRDARADDRSLDEVRADVLCDLLLTGHATSEASAASIPAADAIRARVQITVPALALLGRSTAAADLSGHGPIPLDIARQLTADAPGWDRVLTDPVTGCVIAVDRYRPLEQQRRALRVRDEHCRFPGCRQPTHRCDIDHTVAAAHDGPTEICNLAHLCRRHHTLKHHSAWRVEQQPGGTLVWTSPLGRRYDDVPARRLIFTVADDPPPF